MVTKRNRKHNLTRIREYDRCECGHTIKYHNKDECCAIGCKCKKGYYDE